MSVYYSFYLAKKDAEGKFTYFAPYDKDGNAYALLTVSRSFITIADFDDCAECLNINQLDEELTKLCCITDLDDEPYCDARAISFDNMVRLRDINNSGMYVGYVNREDAEYIVNNKYFIPSRYDVDLIDPVLAAEMKDEKLFHTAFIACNDSSYYADLLIKNVYELDTKNLYFVRNWE